jgi:hypothetical protein
VAKAKHGSGAAQPQLVDELIALVVGQVMRTIEDAKRGVFFGCPIPWGLRLTASRRPLQAA